MHDLLQNLAIVLGVAAVISLLFQKLKQPVVLGYLLAGMIIGPHVPIPLVANSDTVHTLSEIGVIFLMFSLGLDFRIRRLLKSLPTAGVICAIECTLMLWFGYTVGRAFGWPPLESVYAGAIVAISSTTIIIKAFSEEKIRGQLSRIVFAILIVEDLVAVLLLAILPAFSAHRDASGWMLVQTAGTLFMFLVLLLVVGALLIPRLMRYILPLQRPELTLLISVGICLTISLLTKKMGYSVALGAFIAGSLMAESGDDGYLNALIHPVRDIFAAIFFVSVGMLLDPKLLIHYWPAVLIFTVIVLAGKCLSVTVATFLTGTTPRLSIQTGMSLAQIGEFSFIIASVGLMSGGTRDFLYPIAVSVSALTTLTTPWLIRSSDAVAKWVDRQLPKSIQTFSILYGTWIHHLKDTPQPAIQRSRVRHLLRLLLIDGVSFAAIVIGGTLSVNILTNRLTEWTSLPHEWTYGVVVGGILLLLAPFTIGIFRCVRTLGVTLATEALPQQKTNVPDLAAAPRRALVVTLQLLIVLLVLAPMLAFTQPFLPSYYGISVLALAVIILGISFWRSTTQLQGHVRAGAEIVIEALSASMNHRHKSIVNFENLLPGLGPVTSVRLTPNSPAVGKSLSDLNLRGITGASVIAIMHDKESIGTPTGKELLREGDVLAITGTADTIQAAKQILAGQS